MGMKTDYFDVEGIANAASYAHLHETAKRNAAIPFTVRGRLAYAVVCRIRDIVLSVLGLVLLSPVFVIVMLAARFSTRSSAFFRQTRVGKDGRLFTVYKIRTLRADAPAQALKGHGETMATPLGRILRRYKLDEIPQLWNVLKGQMSMIGPRPEMPFIVETYTPIQRIRLSVKPGITGMWQLSRVREREIHRYIEYDLFYLANRSFGFDTWLIWRTLFLIAFAVQTKVRMAASLWERDTSWRKLVDDRGRAIPRRTGPLLSKIWGVAAGVILVLVTVPAVMQAVLAKKDLQRAADAMLSAREAVRALDVNKLDAALDKADARLDRADHRLNSWLVLPARLVPGVRGNLLVSGALTTAGRELVAAGRESVGLLETLPFENGRLVPPWKDGALDIGQMALARGPALRIQEHVANAHTAVNESHGVLLLPQVREARAQALDVLKQAHREADVAAGAAVLIPGMFGAESPRTWVIAAENTAELRGRGGYPGSLGTAVADQGRLTLGDFTATADLPELKPQTGPGVPEEYLQHYSRLAGTTAWQNLTMSPNFSSGARLLLGNLATSAGIHADGVISMDPKALEYLLDITGPVKVQGVSFPISKENVVDWSLNGAYFQFDKSNNARREALSDVARTVWERLIGATDLDTKKLAEALGKAISERRIVIYSSDALEESLIKRLGIGGDLTNPPGDYFLVLGQNLGENKMDYYLKRSISYKGGVRNDGSVRSTLDVTVENTLQPGAPVPGYIGGARPRINLSERAARTYLSMYIPRNAVLLGVKIDGKQTTQIDDRIELGKRLIVANLDVAAGAKRHVVLDYRIPRALVDGKYRLSVQNQATVNADNVSVEVRAPKKATIEKREGFYRGSTLNWSGPVSSNMSFSADLRLPWFSRVTSKIGGFLKRSIGSE
jgi:lipopolysaccharide/colanic/teichoic acid biosynthesis glycosyltransferase